MKLAEILQQIITQAKESVRDTRQALRELRSLEKSPLKGLKAIQQLRKVFANATGVQVYIDYGNLPWEFDSEIDHVLYRMIQEGLTNAFRHGKATEVHVRLWIFNTKEQSELIVRIQDNGQGALEIKKGIGPARHGGTNPETQRPVSSKKYLWRVWSHRQDSASCRRKNR